MPHIALNAKSAAGRKRTGYSAGRDGMFQALPRRTMWSKRSENYLLYVLNAMVKSGNINGHVSPKSVDIKRFIYILLATH